MRFVVVVNEKSGGGFTIETVKPLFTEHAPQIHVSHWVAVDDSLDDTLESVVETDSRVVVIGGDGTIASVAAIVARKNAVLCPLPGGSINNLCRELGTAPTVVDALSQITSYNIRRIDCATINDTLFLSNVSLGLYADSMVPRDSSEWTLGKFPTSIRRAIRVFKDMRSRRLMINDRVHKTSFVFVGCNEYELSGPNFGERRSLSNGVLQLAVLKTQSRTKLILAATSVMFGRKRNLRHLDISLETTVEISHAKRRFMRVARDGDPMRVHTPVKIEIHPRRLAVLSPKKQ